MHKIWASNDNIGLSAVHDGCKENLDFATESIFCSLIYIYIFGTEPYLRSVKYIKYRVAISMLRVSSHALEIERGRYSSPMTPVNERLCHACQKVEDEFHFMMECKSNSDHRHTFKNKLTTRCPNFADLNQREQFVYMFTNEDNMSLTWLGKCIYKSFQRRNSVTSNL